MNLSEDRRVSVGAVAFAALAPSLAALWYSHGATSAGATQTIYFSTKTLIFCFPLLWWWTAERHRSARPPNTTRSLDLLLGGASGLLIAVLIGTGFASVVKPLIDPAALQQRVRDFGAYDRFLALALFLSVANSGLEEYYWRWFVFGRLREHCRLPAALGLGGLAFAAHHFIALQYLLQNTALAAVLCVGIALGGIIWSVHYQRTGRLLGVWLSHCIVDVAALSCAFVVLY